MIQELQNIRWNQMKNFIRSLLSQDRITLVIKMPNYFDKKEPINK